MELIKKHIIENLREFTNIQNDNSFEEIYQELDFEDKEHFRLIFIYIHNIIEQSKNNSQNQLKVIHINFENCDEKISNLILIFILIKIFREFYSEDNKSHKDSTENKILNNLITKRKSLQICPSGAIKNNKISKRWKKEKDINKKLIKFYEKYQNATLDIKSIINISAKMFDNISEYLVEKPYAISVENFNKLKSYNIINTEYTLNDLDGQDSNLIDKLDTLVIYDCNRKKSMLNFSLDEINKWNTNYNTNFKNYLIFTFNNQKQSINNIRNRVDTIRERFKIPSNASYTILKSEIDFLFNNDEKINVSIELTELEKSEDWNKFMEGINIRELYELRSIKLMNIYSICFTNEIKKYIIDEIFSYNESSKLITSSTKNSLLEIPDENIKELKEFLSSTLDLIINSKIKEKIADKLKDIDSIVFDEFIIRNTQLLSFLKKELRYKKLMSWSDLSENQSTNILFLSYRNQGNYPNYFYPNLFEIEFDKNIKAVAILPKLFFFNHYKWTKYNLYKDYHTYLSHPVRESYFKWNDLKKLRLEKELFNIDWALENEYSSFENRETYKVKLSGQKAKTYHSSDLIIYSGNDLENLKIERTRLFYENIDFDGKYKIQKLDELLDEFNPAEKLIDTSQQEKELEIIRKQLGLENETAGRIWKVLLNKKSESIGTDILYEELKQLFSKSNIPLVKRSYFINSWLNIESDILMPRGNKVVKVLFNYLNLGDDYRLILYRLKNASVSGKIEATRKYSSLLKDLFTNGCFDSGVDLEWLLKNNIEFYQKNHSLEELGIDDKNPLSGLITLVELVMPELNLLELKCIEKQTYE